MKEARQDLLGRLCEGHQKVAVIEIKSNILHSFSYRI